MPCRTMCTVCGFAALSHSYFIRLYLFDGKGRLQNRHIGFADGLLLCLVAKLSSCIISCSAKQFKCLKIKLNRIGIPP
ncbi:hypothetical protein D0T90_07640 [Neisseria animalis]|uniref:Uncharacterized protein n=1 Tax=Neisseria animalis TaxID=492 RepID=A0A5P3MS04_NEIAN|nr:hypothetical protein D0T90_07640 [Neisseria animalis]ROW31726.1 hypothetical protein CGZ60_08645 [Neisseria animalis]